MPHAAPVTTAPRPRGFRVLRWTIALALATGSISAGASVAVAAPAEDDTTVSWSARPADTAQGSGRPNFSYEALPGAMFSDAILVTNRGSSPITLEVYAADGFLTADGSLDLLARSEPSTELGSWIDLGQDSITLAGGETTEVPFEVVIPSTVQPGDYAAGVVASMSVESDSGVITERRLGSRMHLRVAGDIVPSLTVSDVRIDYQGELNPFAAGAATVTFALTNTGNARIAPGGSVDVSGLFGWGATTVSLADVPELLPGSSLERTIEVDGVLPLFFTTADVSVGGDVVQRPGAPVGDALAVTAVAASASTWTIPWTALAVLLVVIGLVVWLIVSRRRAKRTRQREVDEAVAAALAARDAADADAPADASADADAPVNANAPAEQAADRGV
ncbi:DUF916 domain-containing protein [Microbacterium sp. SLBN-146]|uniref:COG1470 family protein n=1 Tax=Microbacterium sp. SLBN-146 TaxID=2768457 RepID=UPI00114E8DE2|nr:DUF916 domain-containing protein [Microbacterium sp. SLBN-146]TQJ31166.1 hypothetical protein FBY39_1628 [Microbacterium sp. SLBN-146]